MTAVGLVPTRRRGGAFARDIEKAVVAHINVLE
jgi:hypothetical protein